MKADKARIIGHPVAHLGWSSALVPAGFVSSTTASSAASSAAAEGSAATAAGAAGAEGSDVDGVLKWKILKGTDIKQ